LRTNNQITAPELRVVDDKGENLGVMPKEQAFTLAKERGLDLIEIAPSAKPPVAKIISFDKFRYQEEKKLKKQRAQQKGQDWKQVQISMRAARNDLEIRARQAEEFLERGDQVTVVMRMRGREKAHKDFARGKLEEFLKIINVEYQRMSEPKFGGNGFIIQIGKK
jgi:translation initiation factor IF-3